MDRYQNLVLALLFVPMLAHADPRVDAMVNQCRAVHGKDVCRLDHGDLVTKDAFVPGMGWIRAKSMNKLISARDSMCEVIEQMCSQWDSDDCRAVRVSWRH